MKSTNSEQCVLYHYNQRDCSSSASGIRSSTLRNFSRFLSLHPSCVQILYPSDQQCSNTLPCQWCVVCCFVSYLTILYEFYGLFTVMNIVNKYACLGELDRTGQEKVIATFKFFLGIAGQFCNDLQTAEVR